MKITSKSMRNLATTLIAIVSIAGAPNVASANEPPPLPVNLVQVVSGGDWEDGESHGYVRFSVFENGFEHLNQQIVIEWIQHPGGPNQEAVLVSRLVVNDDPLGQPVWSLGQAAFVFEGGKSSIRFEATNTREPDQTETFSIKLLGPGAIKVEKAD